MFCPICQGKMKPFQAAMECTVCQNRFFILQTFDSGKRPLPRSELPAEDITIFTIKELLKEDKC